MTIQDYLERMNYGESITYLQAINWGDDTVKIKMICDEFNCTEDEAKKEIIKYQSN